VGRFGVELRSAQLEGNTLAGHAVVFGAIAELKGHYESIAPGAFDESLKQDRDVKALWNHDPTKVLGSTRAGTLRLAADPAGLSFEVDLPGTSYAADLRHLVERRDVASMSFGFLEGEDEWSVAPDGRQLRTHTRVKRLVEVSPVSIPAYDGTDCYLRHLTFDSPTPTLREQLVRLRAAVLLKG
jgi:HK97 family phage prohead protease